MKLSKRYETFTAWRGFAALWVFLYHTALVIIHKHPNLSSPFLSFVLMGAFRVPLFFVISGYCMAASAESKLAKGSKQFILSRFWRIYPTCWVALFLYAVIDLLLCCLARHGIVQNNMSDMAHKGMLFWFSNFTLTHVLLHQDSIVIVTWTMCYEIAFYLIIASLIAVRNIVGGFSGILTSLHAIMLFAICLQLVFPACFPLDVFPQFGIGVLVYDVLQCSMSRFRQILGISALAAIMGLMFKHDSFVGFQQPVHKTYMATLCFAAYLIVFARYDVWLSKKWIFRFFSVIGVFSYSLYLTHYFAIGIINQMLNRVYPNCSWNLQFILTISLALLFAKIFYELVEKRYSTYSRIAIAPQSVRTQMRDLINA